MVALEATNLEPPLRWRTPLEPLPRSAVDRNHEEETMKRDELADLIRCVVVLISELGRLHKLGVISAKRYHETMFLCHPNVMQSVLKEVEE